SYLPIYIYIYIWLFIFVLGYLFILICTFKIYIIILFIFYISLQQPIQSSESFRPSAIVSAINSSRFRYSNSSSLGYRGNILNREQQDAQELFQMVSSALKSEESKLQKQYSHSSILDINHINDMLESKSSVSIKPKAILQNPMNGLLASRL